jgi:hypothetical protein
MKKQLSPQILATLTKLAAEGRQAWQNGAISEAEKKFLAAWDSLPEPKTDQDYAQSLSRGLVTFYGDTKQYEKAKQWLQTVRKAYGGGSNPSVDFLAGTVAFDSGDLDGAFHLFHRLYSEFRERPFEGKDHKYLDFYRDRTGKKR